MRELSITYHSLVNHMRVLALMSLLLLPVLGLAQKQTFGGTVIDEKTASPWEDVEITITAKETGKVLLTETGDEGKFSFKNAPIGWYSLEISDEDFNEKKFDFEVTETHKPNLNFAISPKVSWMWNWGDSGNQEHYWSHFVAKILLYFYFACLVLIIFYSILQLSLAIAYVRHRKKKVIAIEEGPVYDPTNTPMVTIQLPMYNELYVADRIIETIAAFDYPADKLQIQVLDDSTDETKELIAEKVAEVAARGINIQHIHRTDRTGYKAGALDAAMDQVQGEFIAIFDADFVPDPDFLQRTMPYFRNDNVGVVQTRWGHINKDYSLLTELQAFGLNGHFAIEQGGRNASGHFINFNGTGGVWRKTCIADAGGWEHDTLTEDLDLSYRAQLKGWKFRYLEHVISPAELPITMSALKSQQHRWMKGGAECFIKMWKRISFTKGVKFGDRIHGLSHLFNSSVFIFILMLSLLTLPILHIKDSFSDLNYLLQYGAIALISTMFLAFYYWHSYRDKKGNGFVVFFKFLFRFIMFLIVSMGLALNNTVAVLEGYMGIKSSFVRTPKFNVNKKSDFKGNKYDKKRLSILNIGEGLLFLLFGYTAVNRAIYGDIGMVPFHAMLTLGYGLVFFYSVAEIRSANKSR
ncbi:MAG: cellulose synthase/poly-beta-1,6-N-acetylglucosamine synthase-like glycosyltransferase [Crocinitomicaceae bacterium]|jgi:cellulose synthase/poly-beta-1,6-N-acetylglucosamine synthase-like glycosyltransferase